MSSLRPRDFHLSISYHEPDEGSFPRPGVPGFFLRAYFYDGGAISREYTPANMGLRLDRTTLEDIAKSFEIIIPDLAPLASDVKTMLYQEQQEKRKLLESLRTQRDDLAKRISLLESETPAQETPTVAPTFSTTYTRSIRKPGDSKV